jgi:arsenate reductase
MKIVDENGVEAETVLYLKTEPSVDEIKDVLKKLGFTTARELMRTKEAIYKELDLKIQTEEEKLIEAMAEHPKLIERPIIIKGDRAIIGRPSSVIAPFLGI